MIMQNNNTNLDEKFEQSDGEISILSLLNTLNREKSLIILITFIFTLGSGIYAFRVNPIWRGSFNILIKGEKRGNDISGGLSKLLESNSSLSSLGNSSNKETQRLILKSSSVLKPVFQYVKNYHKQNNLPKIDISFNKWVSQNLDIKFTNRSNILKVGYKNKNKNHILNTLNLISKKYQSYSKTTEIKNLTKTISYLEEQTKIMKAKSNSSSKKYNKFTIENGLGNIDGFIGLGASSNPLSIGSMIQDSSISMPLSMNKFDDTKILEGGGKSLKNRRFASQFERLESYESQYIDLSSKLKPNSKTLSELKLKISNLKSSLKRPNEILLEYKKIFNEAERDSIILSQLENTLELMKLEKINAPVAWELISAPTIEDDVVFPNKKLILFASFIISMFSACSLAILKEKRKGLIFELDDFKSLIPYKYLNNLYKNNEIFNSIIMKNILKIYKLETDIVIVYLSNNFFSQEPQYNPKIFDSNFNIEIVSKNIESINNYSNIVLIVEPGKITNTNINILKNYFATCKKNILGWFFVSDIKSNLITKEI